MQNKTVHKKLRVLFASRLVEEKGIRTVIDVIQTLATTQPELGAKIEWIFCSDGAYSETITQLAKNHDNITYHGKVSRETLAELYRNSDILLMPSIFLETFGLTALEANACGLAVIGPRKGGLKDFVSTSLALDETRRTQSIIEILGNTMLGTKSIAPVDIRMFSKEQWEKKLSEIFRDHTKILLVHDYEENIGGAEVYITLLRETLTQMGKEVQFLGYTGKTSSLLRKVLFATAIFGYMRSRKMQHTLRTFTPDAIWMHSVLRYHGIWSLKAIQQYTNKYSDCETFLSHHDIGLIAPFPQYITDEEEIPKSISLQEFLRNTHGKKTLLAGIKWLYVRSLKKAFPKKKKHIIFSTFLEKHIRHHFEQDAIITLPHTYDEKIFHP